MNDLIHEFIDYGGFDQGYVNRKVHGGISDDFGRVYELVGYTRRYIRWLSNCG